VFDRVLQFWLTAAHATASSGRNVHEAVTLMPADRDAYVQLQATDGDPRGAHIHLHGVDIVAMAMRAAAAGASLKRLTADAATLRSPAGQALCVIRHHGQAVRPVPSTLPGGTRFLIDQVCIDIPDIPTGCFENECRFWADLTGWQRQVSKVRSEFSYLVRPSWSPLRILLQRRDDNEGGARAHLDLASDDVATVVQHLSLLGARPLKIFDHWTVLQDPAGFPSCVTARDPHTGELDLGSQAR
jgi:Glyoxalase-like domain